MWKEKDARGLLKYDIIFTLLVQAAPPVVVI